MIFHDHKELKDRIERFSNRKARDRINVFEDTSSFMSIFGGDVIRVAGNDYFVLGDAREGRFGIDDQPKYWVKNTIDLTTGDRKILKLVFHEQFTTDLGWIRIRYWRSPEKERDLLALVHGDARFMQGTTVNDSIGNTVRVLDFINGSSFYNVITSLDVPHEKYYFEMLPNVMRRLIPCLEAITKFHEHGLRHGDIRSDHIMINTETKTYVWIDFDYEVDFSDYDVWCMGNVITLAVGQGSHTIYKIRHNPQAYQHLRSPIEETDALVLYRNRVANLRKLFPYIPEELNDILRRFSVGSGKSYADVQSIVNDLKAVFS